MTAFPCFRCDEQLALRIFEVLRSRGFDLRELTLDERRSDGGVGWGALNESVEVSVEDLEKEAERTQICDCKRDAAEVRIYVDKPPNVEWYDVVFAFKDGTYRDERLDNRQLFLDLIEALFHEPGIYDREADWKRLNRDVHLKPRPCVDFFMFFLKTLAWLQGNVAPKSK
jgi:hypothetical protein